MATIPVDGGRIACRRLGSGPPLLVLNGLAATHADWDPAFIDRLASANELVLIDNRGIGASTDDGGPFDVAKLAADSARVIETLELGPASVLGWSVGGFIAQALAVNHPAHVDKLVLLSTDPGGPGTELASPAVLAQLTDMSGSPHDQARRLLSVLFPSDLADSIYREFGDVVAAARVGLRDRLGELRAPVLVATGTEDVVIPASNGLSLVNAIPGAWLAQFSGGGHAFMAQHPHRLADLINVFLAS
jgi:pimeloyl-ACP methyl ester carboxylesterase